MDLKRKISRSSQQCIHPNSGAVDKACCCAWRPNKTSNDLLFIPTPIYPHTAGLTGAELSVKQISQSHGGLHVRRYYEGLRGGESTNRSYPARSHIYNTNRPRAEEHVGKTLSHRLSTASPSQTQPTRL